MSAAWFLAAPVQTPCQHCVEQGPEFVGGCPHSDAVKMEPCPSPGCRCIGLVSQGGLCESCYFETK